MIAFGGINWALDGAAAPVSAVLRLEFRERGDRDVILAGDRVPHIRAHLFLPGELQERTALEVDRGHSALIRLPQQCLIDPSRDLAARIEYDGLE